MKLAQKGNCAKGYADAHFRLGLAKSEMGDLLQAKTYYQQGLILREKLGDSLDIAKGYKNLGQLYTRLNLYDSAQYYLRRAIEFIQYRKELALAKMYNDLGTLYKDSNRFGLARVYYQRGMLLYTQLRPNELETLEEIRSGRATLRMNYAVLIQDHFNQRQAAKDSLLRSLRDFKNLDAKKYIPLCHLLLGNNAYYQRDLPLSETYYLKSISDSLLLNPLDRAKTYKNLGRVYLDQGKYTQARQNLELSRKILVPLNNQAELALLQFEWANFFYEQARFADAARNYLKVLRLQPKDTLLVGRTLFFLSDAYQELKLPKQAKRYEDQLIRLLNNLNSEQGNLAFQELFRYQMDKQSLLKQYLQNQKELIYQRSLTWGAVLLGLLLLAIGGIYLFRQRQIAAVREAKIAQQNEEIALNNKNLAQQEAELARKKEQVAIQQNLALLRQKELETQYARLEAQDLIQQKIGEELHDGVGSMLATVKMNLLTVEEVLDSLPQERIITYNQANRLLDEACDKVRKLSHEFGEALLKQFGLKAQLEALLEAIGTSKLQVELVTHGLNQRQDFQLELNLYRIIQELVHNVIKHAQATHISIQVSYFPENVNVVIDDDGRGFDVQSIQDSPGLGMLSIQSRVNEHSGHIHFDSKPGRGTTVMIDIPL
ncbi:tetratricopeptide repeat-containing sensor histidine kinase [Haliscomenobacter sp.]|uniref:tetratricopeptide repeat-containing sensor histidine kinase n=1 Tax=Haliscomenobacter sp. TaxID=2717303 RepID=UPI003BAB14BD